MILEEFRNIKSDRSELRKFGIMIGIVLGLLGGLFLWRGRDYYSSFLIISVIFLFSGLVLPRLLIPIYRAWMTFAILIGWLMTRVILCFLFYMVFAPIGLGTRLFGKDFLHTKFDRNMNSYWIPKESVEAKRTDYERQF